MLNKIRKLKNKKGFTLVELIVVIAIIAVLTAVIVPLIGRYSTQAVYTTLQDGCKTISNNINTVIAEVAQSGKVASATQVTGTKSGGSLVVTFGASGTSQTATNSALITDATIAGLSDANSKAAAKLANSLVGTLPDGAVFYADLQGGAVTGCVYATDGSAIAAAPSGITAVSGFENAYEISGRAMGCSGKFIPAASAS